MMKKAFVLLACLSAFYAVHASEIWWQINTGTQEFANEWDSARLYYFNTSDKTLSGQYGHALDGTASKSALQVLDYAASTFSGNLSSYSFYVELYNSATYASSEDHSDAYRSAAVSWNDLQSAVYGGGTAYGTSPYTFSTFTSQVIPEPTSGLMILLGLAALGLKRRKA